MKFSNRYPLKPYQSQDFNKIKRVVAEYPLATLISGHSEFPTVSQVPLIFNETEEKLLGHFDKNNPHCTHILEGGNIYVVFNGPNHYITPGIYPDVQYPGWNYISVHIKGRIHPITDTERLSYILLELAARNEPEGSSYQLSPTQPDFDRLINLILGFEIELLDVKGVFKLAQDKGSPHVDLARDHLAKMGKRDILAFLRMLLD